MKHIGAQSHAKLMSDIAVPQSNRVHVHNLFDEKSGNQSLNQAMIPS
jgi:hypothetical protein